MIEDHAGRAIIEPQYQAALVAIAGRQHTQRCPSNVEPLADAGAANKGLLLGQATRLEDEANSLIEEQEMGDVQFDDEGGEGDTMVVERERDLTLSAQARQTIADIESALLRLTTGRYGYSLESGRPIPRERLEAIPWATMLVEEKVGGIGRR